MDLTDAQWRKSSYSGTSGGDCVEVADLPHAVAIRDSKRPESAALIVGSATFAAFVAATRRA